MQPYEPSGKRQIHRIDKHSFGLWIVYANFENCAEQHGFGMRKNRQNRQ